VPYHCNQKLFKSILPTDVTTLQNFQTFSSDITWYDRLCTLPNPWTKLMNSDKIILEKKRKETTIASQQKKKRRLGLRERQRNSTEESCACCHSPRSSGTGTRRKTP
jgi:hypothetical protein